MLDKHNVTLTDDDAELHNTQGVTASASASATASATARVLPQPTSSKPTQVRRRTTLSAMRLFVLFFNSKIYFRCINALSVIQSLEASVHFSITVHLTE